MRAVHVISELCVGGVATMLSDLLPALLKRGIDVSLWHFGTGGNVRPDTIASRCPTLDLGHRRELLHRRVRRLIERFNQSGADIIHLHDLSVDVVLAALISDARTIAHVHEAPTRKIFHVPLYTRLGIVRRAFRPMTLRRFDAIMTCSNSSEEFALRAYGIPRDRLHVIRNGVDVQRIRMEARSEEETRGRSRDSVRFGYLGRLDSIKNLPLLLSACDRMKKDSCDWSLSIIGDGPLRFALEGRVSEAALSDRITFVGEVSNPVAHLNQIDVLVHPSDSEGMSISMLEAMSLGIPIVAVEVGGNAECMVDGQTGLFVPPGDEKAFTDACRRLGCDDELRVQMGRNGRRRVMAEFAIERVATEIAACYAQLMDQPPTVKVSPREDKLRAEPSPAGVGRITR